MSAQDEVFIGRQPILNRREGIFAYELLFRHSAEAGSAEIGQVRTAASRVIVDTFSTIGIEAVLGPHRGFVNLTREMLLSDMVEALPRDKVVLELLETVPANPNIQARCRQLRRAGFTLALDDYEVDDPRASLVAEVDFIKVDVMLVDPRALPWLVRKLRRHPVKLLAEKVEDREMFERCRKLGFEYFQGFYFARPLTITGRRLDPARGLLLKIFDQLGRNAEVEDLSETFKRHPTLGVNLLRLVNSAALARRHRISTLPAALAFLGRRQLRRWIMLLLFAGSDAQGLSNPLLQMAAQRGRVMELVAGAGDAARPPDIADQAFLVGMLSLMDALLGTPLDALAQQLNLEEHMKQALVDRKGDLGALLELVEALEQDGVPAGHPGLEVWQQTPVALAGFQLEAYGWVDRLLRGGGESSS